MGVYKSRQCIVFFCFFSFSFFFLKCYVRLFLLFPQKCVTHKLKGCFSTFPTARTANTRSNWIMPSLQACVCGLLSGFSSRQLQKQQHHILTSAFFFLSLFVAVCNAAYLHSFSGVESVSDTVLITICCRAPTCATACIKTCVGGRYWFWD